MAIQLDLFKVQQPAGENRLAAYLNESAKLPVEMVVTRNRVTMVSVQFPPGRPVRLRVHEAFLFAPPEVHAALRRYLRTRRKEAWKIVARYAGSISAGPSAAETASRGVTRGRVYDLKMLYDAVNREFFNGGVKASIEWGRQRPVRRKIRRRVTSIRYGSYHAGSNLIRVHPLLDDERVPQEFVRYIVFHEMLHAIVPPVIRNGRRFDHGPEFRRIEATYPGFSRMKTLSRELLDVLIR